MPQLLYRHAEGPRGSELEQSVVRIIVGVALLSYFAYISESSLHSSAETHPGVLTVAALFLGVALSISACIVFWRGDVPARRIAAIVLDVGALSYVFLIGGSHAAPLYFLYQWIIIGYGFRFGKISVRCSDPFAHRLWLDHMHGTLLGKRARPFTWLVGRHSDDFHLLQYARWQTLQGIGAC